MQFVTPFAILIIITCPILFTLFRDTEKLWLDGGMWILSIILLLYKHVKWISKKYLPFYWLVFLIICFPSNFSYGLLCQPDDVNYILGEMFMFMVVPIVVADVWMILVILLIGIYLAIVLYNSSFIYLSVPKDIDQVLALYILGIVFGIVLAHKKGSDKKNKLETMYTLAGSISHEINTPLTIIKDNADQLIKALPSSKQPWINSLHIISQECVMMSDIIKIILNNAQNFSDIKKHYRITSLYHVIQKVLQHYPYSYHKHFNQSQIKWKKKTKF